MNAQRVFDKQALKYSLVNNLTAIYSSLLKIMYNIKLYLFKLFFLYKNSHFSLYYTVNNHESLNTQFYQKYTIAARLCFKASNFLVRVKNLKRNWSCTMKWLASLYVFHKKQHNHYWTVTHQKHTIRAKKRISPQGLYQTNCIRDLHVRSFALVHLIFTWKPALYLKLILNRKIK